MQIVRQMERVLGEFGKAITQQCIAAAPTFAGRRRRSTQATPRRRRHPGPSRRAQPQRHPPHARRQVSRGGRGGRPPREQSRRDMARIVDHTGKGVLGGRQTVIVSATLRPETLDQYVHIAPNLLHVIASRDASGAEPAAGANGAGADGDMAEPTAAARYLRTCSTSPSPPMVDTRWIDSARRSTPPARRRTGFSQLRAQTQRHAG